jgi:hypothetical protein
VREISLASAARGDAPTRDAKSKHRQRLGAFDDDPGATANEGEAEEIFHELPAAQDCVVKVCVELRAVVLPHETGELRVAKTSARISPEAETEAGTMAEVE